MGQRTSNIQVKKLNRKRVFQYVNKKEKISMPEIAAALGISGPTVLQIIKELKADGVVQEVGEFSSTGGRKAKAIAAVHDACCALGVDITRNHVSLVLTDLSKEVRKHIRIQKPFQYEESYFAQLGEVVKDFIEESEVAKEKVLGVGISLAGIVDSNRNYVPYSHMLNISNLSCERFTNYIPYPCTLINDANAAAITEGHESTEVGNLIYLSLSNSVGGAIITKQVSGILQGNEEQGGAFHNIYVGDNWRSGEFGHITLEKNGPKCYCGRNGCFDVYCSAANLAKSAGGKLEDFFRGLDAGDEKLKLVWEQYLAYLVIAVENLRMCYDCDIILGGYVGSLMGRHIFEVQKLAAQRSIFGESGEYVRLGRYQVEASALGAAIHYIEKFISTI